MPVSRKRPVTEEVATVQKDIDVFSGWLTRLENPDSVLRYESAGRGVRLYEDLERDWQVFSMLQTRTLALQACEWQVEAASDKRADKKIAEFVDKVFRLANFDKMTGSLMHAILTGYKPIEVMWEMSEGDVWISEFRGRRPSRFVFDVDCNLRLLTLQNIFDGEMVPERKFVTWSYGGRDHNPYGRGLGYQLYWPVWFKKNGVKFWMVFAEKFGSPTPVAKYPPGASSEDKENLLDAIKAIQQETGIRIPEGFAVELLEAKRAGDATYEQLCEYFDKSIAKIILGQTLTSDQGERGSYSLGQVHNDVRREILKSDSDEMCELINNTVVRWLVDYNFPTEGRQAYPRIWRRTEPEQDLKPLAERDKLILVDMGLASRVPETYISDTYNIPLAKEGEATIGSQGVESRESRVNEPNPTTFADSRGQVYTLDKPVKSVDLTPSGGAIDPRLLLGQLAVDRMADEAVAQSADDIELLMGPLMTFIQEAQSLEEIGETIYDLYPTLDSTRFQELLTRAMLASGLTGYGTAEKSDK